MKTKFLSLKNCKDYSVHDNVFNWVKYFVEDLDNEIGEDFVLFLKNNLLLPYPYGVFILLDEDTNDILGVVSFVPEDRGVGQELKIEGGWIGGFNIKRELRGLGYGTELAKGLDEYLKNIENRPVKVNLFTKNNASMKIYERLGFKNTGLKVTREGSENEVYSKLYY